MFVRYDRPLRADVRPLTYDLTILVALRWIPPAHPNGNINSYEVYTARFATGPWSKAAIEGSKREYVIRDARPGQIYYFKVPHSSSPRTFSHYVGSPEWYRMSFFHFVLSSTSSFNSTLSVSLLHESFHLVFCLPLRLFPGAGASNILLSTCPSSLLLTCPHHYFLKGTLISVRCCF